MSEIIVGIGEIKVTKDPSCIIKTFALGSCIAVTMYDKKSGAGGMVHIALHDSKIDLKKSKEKPGYFADTGIRELIRQMKKINPELKKYDLIIRLIGGANVIKVENFFNIGEMNIISAKKILKKEGFTIFREDTGKDISRTVFFNVSNNSVTIKNQQQGIWQI